MSIQLLVNEYSCGCMGNTVQWDVWSKYELQEFLKPSLRISSKQKRQSLPAADGFRSSSSTQKSEGLVEFIGVLMIKVMKGTNLAVRDMFSSDPYVVLTLGQQLKKMAIQDSVAGQYIPASINEGKQCSSI
ncbi:hypothetical protein DM860_012885 [Cuscuta australis]|uniref:Uncharacterized protein n=1 Tax=Cuscuta australis TaxID=267555 RepID=A0A328DUW2_9ASTE|nr:hypothetical protein DM860_012885 [Cuscuta australis]